MDAARINIFSSRILTIPNKRAIMVSPNIGKENAMQEHETKEEVLDRVLMKLSELSDSQIDELVRLASEQGIELE